MTINATRTVRELAIEVPGATRLFEKLGIDYCCGGGSPLETACASAGLTIEEVVRSLEAVQQAGARAEGFRDWRNESLTNLISFILSKHHAFTRQELERLDPLLAKVCSFYGQTHPELLGIQRVFSDLKRELTGHMMKEEQVLFPYVTELEGTRTGGARPVAIFGTVRNPVRMMMVEHDSAGEMLRAIRDLSSNFTAPSEACASYKTLLEALEGLERDLHEHIHLENNLLFPRAIEMEDLA